MPPDPIVPFETFMARALHDPNHGYYARRIQAVGRRGDFTTVPMISDALARAIARWALAAMKETGCRNLIEAGPGEGTLASAVLNSLPWHTRLRTRLHLVETSTPLKERQQKILGNRALWHSSVADALTACKGHALIFSNEWVDAFPVRRFQKTTEGWFEIGVSIGREKQVTEHLIPTPSLPDSTSFQEHHPVNQRIEVHESFQRELQGWMPLWKSGRMLTIDYGSTSPQIYHRRPHGTLRGYLLHQRIEGLKIYQNVGRMDLTADVNFSDLIQWTSPWTDDHSLKSLGNFIDPNSKHSFEAIDGYFGAFLILDQRRHQER